MKFEEAMKALNEGKKVRKKCWSEDFYLYKNGVGNVFLGNFDTKINSRYIPSNISLIKDDWEIVEEKGKKPILDKEEKAYLEAVLKPFKGRIKFLIKGKTVIDKNEFIIIKLDTEAISLPFFEASTMYKGMRINKKYTLEELGLFKND